MRFIVFVAEMAVSVAGLVAVVVFYVAILVVGIIAGRKTTRTQDTNEMFLANRNMGALVAFFTLTGTWIWHLNMFPFELFWNKAQ